MARKSYSNLPFINLLLADDDNGDRLLFDEALRELSIEYFFRSVTNGEPLMNFLKAASGGLPDIVFLDLYMP